MNGLDEIRDIEGFDNIIAATKLPASRDGNLVVRSRQHDYGDGTKLGFAFDLTKDFNSVNLGHSNIQKKKIRYFRISFRTVPSLKEKIQGLLTVEKVEDTRPETHTEKIFLDQGVMPQIILHHNDAELFLHGHEVPCILEFDQ